MSSFSPISLQSSSGMRMCVRICACVWVEWTWMMHYVGILVYQFIPYYASVYTQAHTQSPPHTIWGQWTDRAKSGYCQELYLNLLTPPPPTTQIGLGVGLWTQLFSLLLELCSLCFVFNWFTCMVLCLVMSLVFLFHLVTWWCSIVLCQGQQNARIWWCFLNSVQLSVKWLARLLPWWLILRFSASCFLNSVQISVKWLAQLLPWWLILKCSAFFAF